MVEVLVNDFIKDQVLLNNKEAIIIHGKSSSVLRKEVHRVLKNNPNVITFKQDNWNLGQTIVNLKELE
ncbi:MAG: Smr/MutS family protein [Mollicutes bacterium]|nr:Smr/MutS family protein [Mollicutes bacterium]